MAISKENIFGNTFLLLLYCYFIVIISRNSRTQDTQLVSLTYPEWVLWPSNVCTAWKVSKYRVFSGPHFSVFSPSMGKYGTEKTPYWTLFIWCYSRGQCISRSATREASRIYQFITNNQASLNLWRKGSLVKHQQFSKYYHVVVYQSTDLLL